MKNRRTGNRMNGFGAGLLAAALMVSSAMAPALAKVAPAPARGLADAQLAPQSLASQKAGEAKLAAGQRQAAIDSFEAALAADPRNLQAYHGLAKAAEADGLPGKAVRFYREALQIDPNDLVALERQGIALMARGATARAEANLERLKTLCASPCSSADRLAAAIAKGPPVPVLASKAPEGKATATSAALQTPQP